jgi:exonuclease I
MSYKLKKTFTHRLLIKTKQPLFFNYIYEKRQQLSIKIFLKKNGILRLVKKE